MTFLEFLVELLQVIAILRLGNGIKANSETIAEARKEITELRWR